MCCARRHCASPRLLCWWAQVQEADEPWEFDVLLQEVSQAMQADLDKQEADDKDPTFAPF